MMENNSKLLPSVMLLTGAMIGALSGLFIKLLPFSTGALLGFRFGIPFLLMLPYITRRKNFLGRRKDRTLLWSSSFLNLLRMVFYVTAFRLTAIGNAVVMLYLWPVFSLAVEAAVGKKIPGIKKILIICVAFSGVVIMNSHREFSLDNNDLYGSISMILSAFIFSLAVLLNKKALSGYSEGEVVYFQSSLGALVFIPMLIREISIYKGPELIAGSVYGFLVGIVAFMLFFYALKRVSVFHYSIMTYSEIVFAVLFGIVFLDETLAVNQVAGMIIVVVSSFAAHRVKDDNS